MSQKRKWRVLAIDDEPSMTDWLKILLEHAGYDVRTALIGTRGKELFEAWRPDAVITERNVKSLLSRNSLLNSALPGQQELRAGTANIAEPAWCGCRNYRRHMVYAGLRIALSSSDEIS